MGLFAVVVVTVVEAARRFVCEGGVVNGGLYLLLRDHNKTPHQVLQVPGNLGQDTGRGFIRIRRALRARQLLPSGNEEREGWKRQENGADRQERPGGD